MPRPFRFAVQTGPLHDPDALAAFAVEVESFGYDELYSYDHVGGERPHGAVDPFVALVIAARATEKLRDDVGISHYVVRDPEGFAPVVAALS